jgi:hypothetical protein
MIQGDAAGALQLAEDQRDQQRAAGESQADGLAGQRDWRQTDEHAEYHAQSDGAEVGLGGTADGVAEELRDGGEVFAAGKNADAVAKFEPGVACGDDVHVAAAQPRDRGAHALLQVEFADAFADNLLAGDENPAEIELRVVLLDVGFEGLAENLFRAPADRRHHRRRPRCRPAPAVCRRGRSRSSRRAGCD